MKKKITAIYCVKNEEEFLPLSLQTVLPFVDEVVIVNNKSTDKTMQVASQFKGPKVKLVEMNTDFDHSCEFNVRNMAMRHAKGEWLLALDADQLMSDGWREAVDPQLNDPKAECVGVRYEHYVGSYEHIHKGEGDVMESGVPSHCWIFFKKTPHLRWRAAAEVCEWARKQHHASADRSVSAGSVRRIDNATCFHYGFSKRNMMEMSKYRIHRGDYGHDPEIKAKFTQELEESKNPFKFVGPVKHVSYGPEHVPSVIRPMFGTTYQLELDKVGFIQSRRLIATGELT